MGDKNKREEKTYLYLHVDKLVMLSYTDVKFYGIILLCQPLQPTLPSSGFYKPINKCIDSKLNVCMDTYYSTR